MAAAAEAAMMGDKGGDTFLTDMLYKGDKGKTPTKPPKPGSSKPNLRGKRAETDLKQAKMEDDEKESAIDSDEYNDMVYDIEYGKQLINRADDFLEDKPSFSLDDST